MFMDHPRKPISQTAPAAERNYATTKARLLAASRNTLKKGFDMTLAETIKAAATAAAGLDRSKYDATETMNVTGFDSISLSSGITSNIVIGPNFKVEAKANKEKYLDKLDVELKDGNLHFGYATGFGGFLSFAFVDIFIEITLPVLHNIKVSSGAESTISGKFPPEFTAQASSGAEIDLVNIDVISLDLTASSGADIDASGQCRFLSVKASSGGDVSAKKLICDAAEVTASSGGDATVFATSTITSNASSGGDVTVFGSPATTQINDSSGGDTTLRD